MIKFLKSYYYAFLPVLPLLLFWSLKFLMGYGGSMTKERIIVLITGGVIVGFLGYLVEIIAERTAFNRVAIIGIISINILFWVAVCFIGLGEMFVWGSPPFSTVDGNYVYTFLWGTIFNMLIFYGNAFWLYPLKKRLDLKVNYWMLVIFFLLLFSGIEAIGDYKLAEYLGLQFELLELRKLDGQIVPIWVIIFGMTLRLSVVHLFFYFLSFVNVFYINNLKGEKIKQTLEKEKLNAELKFLKAQLNPHFLFNGINSVYHLIDPKPAIAKDTLLKFSNLLRYQLYECNDDLIPLEKEFAHIQDYVEMEKIRKGDDANIELALPNETYGMKIPPLLFTPFIENAFKYVSNHDDGAKNNIAINLRLDTESNKLRFEVNNTVDENKIASNGGIGIPNVKKRLALLFPNQHDLDILEETDRFVVRMSLNLKNEAS